jgi:hypothetical protein
VVSLIGSTILILNGSMIVFTTAHPDGCEGKDARSTILDPTIRRKP